MWSLPNNELDKQTSNSPSMSTDYPGRKRSTLEQLFRFTRPRRSPLETSLNDQVNYSAMIPNNYTSTAHSASYYQVRLFDNNYRY